jgi:ribonuclease P protein subunit RPR2
VIRLLICDDSELAREALRASLTGPAEIEIVGEAADGEEAVALARRFRPDVVLMDVSMPVLDGIVATRRISALLPAVRIVAFAGSDQTDVIAAMIEAGASSYCFKSAPPGELERAIIGEADSRLDFGSLRDELAFEEHLDRQIERALASELSLTLVLLELDEPSRIDDLRESGSAREQTLRDVTRMLLAELEAGEDLFGLGEAFAVVIRGESRDGATAAERLLTALGGAAVPPPVSLSAGIATCPSHAVKRDDLIRRADAALYAAKRTGGNRVVVYGERVPEREIATPEGLRLLVVDDDPSTRALLRTTFEVADFDVEEASDARSARASIRARAPSVLVLDIAMPGLSGLAFCEELKADPATRSVSVVLLSGVAEGTEENARAAGADAFLRKPFSPLALLTVVERLSGAEPSTPTPSSLGEVYGDQALMYARDLRHLVELERGQRVLLERAYSETVSALASALEWKDTGTRAHSQRVQLYAVEVARALEPRLLDDPSVEYGFLLHDVGKIGIPDHILQKPAPLTRAERNLIQTHTLLGHQMLAGVAFLRGDGVRVVRSHHERWDGGGYPDGLAGTEIPLGARVFAVADALDAMTSDRPYRRARSWADAAAEVVRESGRQFDPDVVEAVCLVEPELEEIQRELAVRR